MPLEAFRPKEGEAYDAVALDWDEVIKIQPVRSRHRVVILKLLITEDPLSKGARGYIAANLSFLIKLMGK